VFNSASSCDPFKGDDGVVVSNHCCHCCLPPLGASISFCLSFNSSLLNLPFSFFLSLSLSITSLHGLGQHSSWYSIGTRGQSLEKSSSCLISCRPGFVLYSGVGRLRRTSFCCWPVTPFFLNLPAPLQPPRHCYHLSTPW
jgi:hypothetical protein